METISLGSGIKLEVYRESGACVVAGNRVVFCETKGDALRHALAIENNLLVDTQVMLKELAATITKTKNLLKTFGVKNVSDVMEAYSEKA